MGALGTLWGAPFWHTTEHKTIGGGSIGPAPPHGSPRGCRGRLGQLRAKSTEPCQSWNGELFATPVFCGTEQGVFPEPKVFNYLCNMPKVKERYPVGQVIATSTSHHEACQPDYRRAVKEDPDFAYRGQIGLRVEIDVTAGRNYQ